MEKSKLQNLIEKGFSTYQIAEELKCSQTNIRYWLRKFGLNTQASKYKLKNYKGRNGRKCEICDKELVGMQLKFCSKSCRAMATYHNQPNTNESQKNRGMKRKLSAIKDKGGCCQECGYDKNIAALVFHHRDPENKSFNLDMRRFSNTRQSSLDREIEKCDLLCSNCHMEEHYPDYDIE